MSVTLHLSLLVPTFLFTLKFFDSYFQEKWSPLHTLVLSMQMSCVDKLLENGVDIDLPDKVSLFISGI